MLPEVCMMWHGVGVCVVAHEAGVVFKAATWRVAFILACASFCVTVLPPLLLGQSVFFPPIMLLII